MTRDLHTLVVDRFGVEGHEAWRAAQRRRRRRQVLGFFWFAGLSFLLALILIACLRIAGF